MGKRCARSWARCCGTLVTRPRSHAGPALLTVLIHYAEIMLIGSSLIVTFRITQAYPSTHVTVSRTITSPLLKIVGVITTFTVLNVAIRGLALPFATVLSKKLASDGLYAHSRNPMLLSTLLFFIVGGGTASIAARDPLDCPLAFASMDTLCASL